MMNLQEYILKHSAIILRNDLPTFRGRTIPNKRSILSKIATIISSSSFGAGLKMKQGYNCGFFNIVRAYFCTTKILCNIWLLYLLILRMCTWVNYSIHIQVQIIKFHLIWIRLCRIHWGPYSIYLRRLIKKKNIFSGSHTKK